MMDLSISIVNHNGKDFLDNLLESIYRNTRGISYEVMVADNVSTDGSVEMVEAKYPQVILTENSVQLFFVKATNQNLRKARGRYVVIFNNDTLVPPLAFDRMVRYMDEHREIGALGPKLLNFDHTLQRTCNRFPTLRYALYEYLFIHRLFPRNRCLGENIYADWDRNSVKDVDAVSGACLMVPRRVLQEVGLLDEANLMYNEEVDLCYRIKRKGYRVVYYPQVQILHYGGGSASREPEDMMVRIYHQSFLNYYKKYYGPNVYLLLKTLYHLSYFIIRTQRSLRERLAPEAMGHPRQTLHDPGEGAVREAAARKAR